MSNTILVGIVGHALSGKDSASLRLVTQHGFTFVSTGDVLRAYITEHNLGDMSRENVSRTSTELRRQFGATFPVPQILEQYKDTPKLILCGLRLIAEVNLLKEHGGIVIAITCPIEVRYGRAQKRMRLGDEVPFEDFKRLEQKESRSTDPTEHNIEAVIQMADYTIDNNCSLDEFYEKIDAVVGKL